MSKDVEMETSLLLCGLWCGEKSCPNSEKGWDAQWSDMSLCG